MCDLQLALRAAPSYSGFMAALVSHEGDELKEGFTKGMHRDLAIYLPAMEKQLAMLDALYEEYGLESDEVVWSIHQHIHSLQSWLRVLLGEGISSLVYEG